jgi:hypothetical protein
MKGALFTFHIIVKFYIKTLTGNLLRLLRKYWPMAYLTIIIRSDKDLYLMGNYEKVIFITVA